MGHKRPRSRPTKGKKAKHPSLLKRINRHAAGIDCGSETHFVAVPPERDEEPVRSFKTFTSDLRRLADWLEACKIRTVAMESTGVYWIPIFEILEERGFEVVLVNSRHHPASDPGLRRRSRNPFAQAGCEARQVQGSACSTTLQIQVL